MGTDTGPDLGPDLSLRPATSHDAGELAELLAATRRAADPMMPPLVAGAGSVRSWVARLVEEAEVWVAEQEQLVGFAALREDWLDDLYVGPHHQGTGVGSVLLDLVKAQRPEGFSLWVFAANEPARGFYRRHGLVELEHTDGTGNQERVPDLRMAWPGEDPLGFLRGRIDAVDDELALLLAQRLALTAAVQGYKERPGHAGRDPHRERAIAERMAAHAPGLDPDRVHRVMDVVIGESLDAWEHGAR